MHRHRGSLCWISVRMGERLHVLEGWGGEGEETVRRWLSVEDRMLPEPSEAGEQGSTMNQLAVGDEGSGSAQLSGWGVCKQAL